MIPNPSPKRRSALDLAIVASLAAMAAMNLVVLGEQLQPGPELAVSQGAQRA